MLSHVSIRVSNLEESTQFFLTALAPLAFKDMRFPTVTGLGPESGSGPIPELWLRQHSPSSENNFAKRPTPVHVSFSVDDRALVRRFHAAGIAAGGKDNGAPGERPWMKGYYAAYILDLDGNNIEVVCFSNTE